MIQDFIAKYNGKKVDFDGYYGAQCVDIVQFWAQSLGIPPLVGDPAYTIWNNYDSKYFTRIENGLFNAPSAGDIVIWKPGYNGGFGHIGVAVNGGVFSFTCFEQNDPINSPCHIQTYGYGYGSSGGIYGWLHPKCLDKLTLAQFFKSINDKVETQITDTAFRNYVREQIKNTDSRVTE